jgi:hypothetical protein
LGPHGDGKQEGGLGVGSATGGIAESCQNNSKINFILYKNIQIKHNTFSYTGALYCTILKLHNKYSPVSY